MDAGLLLFVCFFSLVWGQIAAFEDAHKEELFVRPLQNGHVYFHFQFTTLWNESMSELGSFSHYRLFPKSLGEVLKEWNVEEIHLTQTQGLWRGDKWGYPLEEAPPGAELWVWFNKNTYNVDVAWKNLINVLSGMFCASLNFLDATNTVTPRWSFRPQGVSSHSGHAPFARYAALPRETVCTENLTPWKKLLPCGSRSGLGSLLTATKLYDASYHSLGLHVRPVCRRRSAGKSGECTETTLELRQTLSVVFEPPVTSGRQDWSFKKQFKRMVSKVCPLAESSRVYVDLTSNKTAEYFFTLSPEPQDVHTKKSEDGQRVKTAVYDLSEYAGYDRVFNLATTYNTNLHYKDPQHPLVSAHQFQTGYGQEYGGVVCMIYNRHGDSVPVVYFQVLPWFLRMFIHTLKIEHFPVDSAVVVGAVGNTTYPRYIHYVPGRDHQRAYHLELAMSLPPNTVTRLSFQFERALLKWTEYPPDANHGFYINSAVITTPLPSDFTVAEIPRQGKIGSMFDRFQTVEISALRVHTEHMLISLPTPDFSMPYNVICLACTVVAIAFGSLHNLTTRRFVEQDPKKKGLVGKIKEALAKIFKRSQKNTDSDTKNDEKSIDSSENSEVNDSKR